MEGTAAPAGVHEAEQVLGTLYRKYHRPEFIHPDPLEFLHRYPSLKDREIVGMIASCFALGRVDCILRTVEHILDTLGPPREALVSLSERDIRTLFKGFQYRFFGNEHLAAFLGALKGCILDYGSIGCCFFSFMQQGEGTLLPALGRFIEYLSSMAGGRQGMLLCSPEKGSACKRHMLFLRWMVRSDDIDPGGWTTFSPAALVVPVDTHMLAAGRRLGFTRRSQADLKTALEITGALRMICPEDPVKYDFSMTRPGIRREN